MTFLIVAFMAGVLTVLAPCILPLLPVVIGSSAGARSKATPYIVVGSLAVSVIAFTFLLKASTLLITIPPYVWTYLSGGIVTLFGLILLFPSIWERVPYLNTLTNGSNQLVGAGHMRKSFWGDVIIGASLGPVFSTCSPTYFVILATVLPVSLIEGTVYILAYVAGLSMMLLLIGLLGQRLIARLGSVADSRGWFKRSLGALFILVGIAIMFGLDKQFQILILDAGFFDVTKVEQQLLHLVP